MGDTIGEHLCRVGRGELSARQAVEERLERCAELEPTLLAWERLNAQGARAAADRLDAAREQGQPLGPLFGVPIGVKDLFDVAGSPTGCGSPALRAGPAASVDSPLIARLRAAGAVILGKTVTTQFACFDPPPTRNPWNPDRTPGGSSSGSAVAVATGMCLAALGSQTGGSITRPASFCGIAGYKPTHGVLPLEGIYPVAPSLDHPGPLAKSMHDLRLLRMVLANEVPLEPGRLGVGVPPRRLGVLRGPFSDRATADCRSTFDAALRRLGERGVEIADCPLPPAFESVWDEHRTIMLAEIADHHSERLSRLPQDYLPGMRSLIELGRQVTAVAYIRARWHQQRLLAELAGCFAEFEFLVCPSTRGGAPTVETTGDPAFNSPFSHTGLPTVTLPMGLDADGMPLGLQLVAPRLQDERLLDCGVWCEDQLTAA